MENDSEQKALVFPFADMVDYNEGSIVSKIIKHFDDLKVTLFAFDAEQYISEHSAPYEAFFYVIEGNIDFTVSGDVNHLKTGDMLIIPSKAPHSLKTLEKSKALLLMKRSN